MKRLSRALVALTLAATSVAAFVVPADAAPFIVTTVAGNGTSGTIADGALATSGGLGIPGGAVQDLSGNVIFTDMAAHKVRKVLPNGTITTVAGTGATGRSGDGGPATAATLTKPFGITLDRDGNIFVADCDANVVRKISTSGTISTVAGTGTAGTTGEGGPATSAQLSDPCTVAVDSNGSLVIGEWNGARILKVDAGGNLVRIAGTGTSGFTGDGGPAVSAQIANVSGVSYKLDGTLYFTESHPSNRLRKVAPGGTISTVAGTGARWNSGDNGPAAVAELQDPTGVAVDANGVVFVNTPVGRTIRKIDSIGTITTIAGTGTDGYTGDGGAATSARFSGPCSLSVTPNGDLLVADWGNFTVRRIAGIAAASQFAQVSVSVDTTLTFTVAGRSSACNAVTPTGTSTSTSLNLGRIAGSTPVSAAQDIALTTNAAGGAALYIRSSGPLSDSRGNNIADVSGDGWWANAVTFPSAGTAAFGYTIGWVGANNWMPAVTTNQEIASVPSPYTISDCLLFQAQAAPSTAAGAYSTTVIYTAIPRF